MVLIIKAASSKCLSIHRFFLSVSNISIFDVEECCSTMSALRPERETADKSATAVGESACRNNLSKMWENPTR